MWLINRSLLIPFPSIAWLALCTLTAEANPYANAFLLKTEAQVTKSTSNNNHPLTNEPKMNKWDTWVDSSEVRIGSDDLSSFDKAGNNHSYALRVRLKSPKQQRAEQDLLDLDDQKINMENNVFRLDQLRKSYLFIYKTLELKQQTDALNQQLALARLEANTYKKLVTTAEFNPSKIQRAELDVSRLTAQIRVNNRTINRYLVKIGVPVNNKNRIHEFLNHRKWLIRIEEIIQFIDRQTSAPMIDNPALQKLNLASRIAKKQHQRAKAELSTAVQLLQVKYDYNNDLFGATVGIRVPLGKSSFDTIRRNNSYQQAQTAWELKLATIKTNLLDNKLLVHQYYDAYKLEQQLQRSLQTRLKRVIKTGRPDLILSIKKELLSHQDRQQKNYLKIVSAYIDYLSTSGKILEKPLRNWLQTGRPQIGGARHG